MSLFSRKKSLVLMLLLFLIATAKAQMLSRSVIGSTGSNQEQLSYTVGEVSIQTTKASGIQLTQGFQQPDELLGTLVDPLGLLTSFRLYPNPAQHVLTLELESQHPVHLSVVFTDIRGKSVLPAFPLTVQRQQRKRFDLSALASGSYFLTLIPENGQAAKSFRFLKVD